LLYLFTPWTAINLIDFYVVRRGHYSIREIFNPRGMYGHWNWRGLVAYVVGFVVMIPFFSSGMYTGPIARRWAAPISPCWWACRSPPASTCSLPLDRSSPGPAAGGRRGHGPRPGRRATARTA